jgi:hypothetical protein
MRITKMSPRVCGGLATTTGVALLLPKCPMCMLAYFGLASGFWTSTVPVLLGLAICVLAIAIVRLRRDACRCQQN